MAYKPVHLITNDDSLVYKLAATGLHHELGAEDYAEQEGIHYHYLIHWPVTEDTPAALSPTRQGAVKRWRSIFNPCDICHGRSSNYECKTCGLFYLFKWCKDQEHHENVRRYIERKIEANPILDVDFTLGSDFSDTEGSTVRGRNEQE